MADQVDANRPTFQIKQMEMLEKYFLNISIAQPNLKGSKNSHFPERKREYQLHMIADVQDCEGLVSSYKLLKWEAGS